MLIPEEIHRLIQDEQKKQRGLFIPEDGAYLEKLSCEAELITHQDPNGILGFVFFYCNAQDKIASYITLIGTSIEARGKGVGYALLNQVLFISKQRGFSVCQLEVRKNNIQALKFYQKIGFASIEDRGEKYLMSIQLK
ncbi:GNAT family N-acetyltransferase [Simplicispira hankyongi]|uniref:GNAT family N-acetyltransferase n=1 Tax=Simplicispira hankyongi TaxID=2315688 RepID=A0A398CAX9_9BURK|nr:N-acetyltransferase [Simplicispira hankyongi]RID99992.1 GNAT family N-acetyltransferase [Simplicispira hankyongi]